MVDRVWMESALTHVDAHQDIRVIIVKRVGWPLPELNRYIKKKKNLIPLTLKCRPKIVVFKLSIDFVGCHDAKWTLVLLKSLFSPKR